jgi:hypothetical protein
MCDLVAQREIYPRDTKRKSRRLSGGFIARGSAPASGAACVTIYRAATSWFNL